MSTQEPTSGTDFKFCLMLAEYLGCKAGSHAAVANRACHYFIEYSLSPQPSGKLFKYASG